MDIINTLSPLFQHYITLERVNPAATYNYVARNMHDWPVFDSTMHCPKCSGGSWMYVAVKGGATLSQLNDGERLYVGSQTLDRMFRGDGMGGKNFHHAQMRAGNGLDTPESYLRAGNHIDIYRLDAKNLMLRLDQMPTVAVLKPLLEQPTHHAGYWLEQFILVNQSGCWRWNTMRAAVEARKLIRQLGLCA